ncbi:TerB N-terminal domain-containing protein [Bradyrhizobium sp. UFLA05-153]
MAAGERAIFGKAELPGSMFYYGAWVAGQDGETRQYAINPALPAYARQAEIDGQSVPYWPSYEHISPAARCAFLDWMRTGRRNPNYGIGYVFLFFYGLEHRVFVDKGADAPALIQEVERLLSIYGSNNSFQNYATKFLNVARVSQGQRLTLQPLSPERSAGSEMDLATRLYLGERLSSAPGLSAEDALRWVLAMPDTYLKTPAVRCFEEFVTLWKLRFGKRFPNGLVVNSKGNISLRYRAASGGFDVEIRGEHQRRTDPSLLVRELEVLRALVDDCTAELDGFSRLVGRKPEARHSMAAAALLPADLLREPEISVVEDFGRQVDTLVGSQGRGSTTTQVLLNMVGIEIPEGGKIPGPALDTLSTALDVVGIAIEPDRRYGSGAPRADDQVFVFRAVDGGPVDPGRAQFRAMRAQIEVAVLAAAADGDASYEELQRTIARIRAESDLSGVEQARLIAFAVITFNNPPKRDRVMRKLAEASESEREAIAEAAVAVIGGNQNIDAGEVKFLERLHKTLGLPAERIYAGLHRAAAEADEPVALTEEARAAGIPIPKGAPPAAPPTAGIRFDAVRLQKTRKETEAVSALLTDIFTEDALPAGPASPAPTEMSLEGLDGPHGELVELLELRGSMSRADFELHAKDVRLLPDGAIERINDWSFDRFDEPLIEEGDEIVIAAHLRERIAEMKARAA